MVILNNILKPKSKTELFYVRELTKVKALKIQYHKL